MAEPTTAADAAALIDEGRAAFMAGDTFTARQRYRQALELNPDAIDAWIGLAGSVRPYREKRQHLERALAIDPDNSEARAILAQVEARIAAGELLAPGVPREPALPPPAEELAEPLVVVQEEPLPQQAMVTEIGYCYRHPDRETGLRCTNCATPICPDCVRPAPVGQLCPDCTRERRPVNYQVEAWHLVVTAVVALVYGTLMTFLAFNVLGFARFFSFIVAFLLGPIAGEGLVRILEVVAQKKRGRSLQITLSVAYAFGAAPLLVPLFFVAPFLGIALTIFTVIAITTAMARLR
jgi:tetratricopeptide (TPR) repeat protein